MSITPELPFRARNTVEDATQYPIGLFRSGVNWYAKVWSKSGCQYQAIKRPNRLSVAIATGVQLINSEADSVGQQLLLVPERNLWVPVINGPKQYAAQLETYVANPNDVPPPLTTSLVGRVVRTKGQIDTSLLADEVGRTMVFGFPPESLNTFVLSQHEEKLRLLGYSRQEFDQYLREQYQFFLVVLDQTKTISATWSNLYEFFVFHYPDLEPGLEFLWQGLPAVPFDSIDLDITLEAFQATQIEDRTAQQLRGLLYTLWRLNGDFTGTGLTSGGVQELLIPNQPIAHLDAAWTPLHLIS